MEVPLQRLDMRWSGEGLSLWGTNWADRVILQFESPDACEAAVRIQELLKRHALGSGFMERLDQHSILVRSTDRLPVEVLVEASPGETRITLRADGAELSEEEALVIEGVNPKRLEAMADVAAHAARSLRAHLSLHGVTHLRLPLRFGVGADGAFHAEVINPLEADLGTKDMAELANLLGG